MPTGAGKTRTAVDWLLTGPISEGKKVLWLTHSVYLLEQAADTFLDRGPLARGDGDHLSIRLIGGGYGHGTTIGSPLHDVAIATVQSFNRHQTLDNVRHWLKANEAVLVIDEAHHAVAPSWRALLEMAANDTTDAVIGLTATPVRMTESGTSQLAALFGGTAGQLGTAIISEVAVDDLVEQGVLARPVFHTIQTNFDLAAALDESDREHLEAFGDFSPRILNQLVREAPRNHAIVQAYIDGPSGDGSHDFGRAIVYAVNVVHAETLVALFQDKRITAGAVHTGRPRSENNETLNAFREGSLRVIVNVQMLTEGIDVPAADAVLLARPTLSFSLFSQMVGRALRGPKVGGTEYAHIVDFQDLLGEFEVWRVRFSTLELVGELPHEAPGVEPNRADPVPYDLEPLVELALALSASMATAAGEHIDRIPVGYYLVGVDPKGDGAEARLRTLLVYDREKPGYERVEALVAGGGHAELSKGSWVRFFSDLRGPRPTEAHLADLRTSVLATGDMPEFVTLNERDALDPTRVAQDIVDAGGRDFDSLTTGVTAAYTRHSRVVDRIWGDREAFSRDVREEWARILDGRARPLEDRRVRIPAISSRDDWPHGDANVDLAEMGKGLLADRDLFPTPLPRPPRSIEWSLERASTWAVYETETERIVMNSRLNSTALPSVDVVRFVLFHELLHHEQTVLLGMSPVAAQAEAHDAAFYRREHVFPGFAEHDAFLDDFSRRFDVS